MAHVVSDLFHLGEEVGRVAIEGEAADRHGRRQLLRHDLGGVEQIDALEVLILRVRHHLHGKLPFGERAGTDRVVQISAMEVGVDAAQRLRFLPYEAVDSEHGLPVELDQARPAVGCDETERVDTEALHHPVRPRDGAIRHGPHEHVR
jgi:hypothetical protein